MATELITRTWCDLCLEENDQQPAVTLWRFGVDAPGDKWRWVTLDVCAQHQVEVLAPMAERLIKVGLPFDPPAKPVKRSALHRPNAGTKVDTTEEASFVCDHCGAVFTTGQGLSLHTRRAKDHPDYDPSMVRGK